MSSSRSHSRTPQGRSNGRSELDVDYADEVHMQAFAEALNADEFSAFPEQPDPALSPAWPGTHTPSGHRVRKVSALSDFAPVNVRVNRRKRTSKIHDKRQEWLFILVRWPLLLLIFLFIGIEFGFYVLIRQLVNTKEWLSAWRGRKGVLRRRLRNAKTYQEWKDAAVVLDEYLHFDEWKITDEDPYYDWKLVRKVLRSLRTHRESGDARGLLGVLETCIRTNFAGVESSRLYSETFYGSKELIEGITPAYAAARSLIHPSPKAYVGEQEKALEFIRKSSDLSNEEKKRFFKSANTNLGTTALCLSGGATFGYYHFGVVKAFLDADLLPRVISGTSAGGLVAALVCTRTDAELKRLLVPALANRITACEDPIRVWFKRFWTTGARFDSVAWARKATFFTRGSMTFKEAYLRTGRILNVSVIPAERHSPTKLLNYMTAPDTVIWSALLASAAVPGILNPVVLVQKLKDGTLVPWNWGSKFKDGSLRVDIPVQALNLYFNVTHPVVSQVNPHVHLFFFSPQGSAGKPVAHSKGKGWRGNFLLSAAEQWLKLELTKNFKLIRDLDLLPQLLGQDWSSVFLQRFDGTVTIWPRTRFMDWIHILSDPDPVELERMMEVGQLVTWPKLHIIENRYRLEKQILLGRQAVRKVMQPRNGDRSNSRPEAQDAVPPPLIGVPLISPAASLGLDGPLPIDSDAEIAYANGTIRPHRQPHPSSALTPANLAKASGTGQDTRRTNAVRRRWSLNYARQGDDADPVAESDYGRATPDPPPLTETENDRTGPPPSPSTPAGILRRLRTASTTFSPFSSLRRVDRTAGKDATSQTESLIDIPWSADSSSEDDLPVDSRRPTRSSSVLENWDDNDRGGA